MKRRSLATIAIASITLAVGVVGLMASRNRQRQIEHRPADGTIRYNCSSQSKSVDYDPRNAGPSELNILARWSAGQPIAWNVQRPGHKAVPATTFDAHTDSIGGSQGLQWRDEGNQTRIAILSFSDVVGEYGPDTLWATVFKTDGQGGAVDREVAPMNLTCGPNPTTFRKE